MTRPGAADVEVAKRLLDHECSRLEERSGVGDRAAAAVRVYEKLFARLSPVIGVAGMRALLARSATLTKAELPCFARITASDKAESAAEQLMGCFAGLDEAEATEAAGALYGTLLGLLNSFIGERLVRQVLRSEFPAMDTSTPKETES